MVCYKNIDYNNRIFVDYYKLTGYELIIYGLVLKHSEGLRREALSECKKDSMSDNRMTKAVKELHKRGLIEYKELDKKKNMLNYYVKAKTGNTFGTGYTTVSNGAIIRAVNKVITPGQFKLYVLLLRYSFSKGECSPATTTLAREVRSSRATISRELKKLEIASYIKRVYEYEKAYDYSRGYNRLICKLLI